MVTKKEARKTTPEQPGPLQLSGQVAPHAHLVQIRQVRGMFEYRTPAVEHEPGDFQVGARTAQRVDDRGLVVEVELEIEMPCILDGHRHLAVFVVAVYEVCYQIDSKANLSTEAVHHFACINGIYNAWSFWREFVQSSMARMGHPPLAMPLLQAEQAVRLAGLVKSE